MSHWKKLSLKSKMFLAFSSVLLFIISLIFYVFYHSNVNEIKKQTQSLSTLLSRQVDRTLELYFQDIERLSISVYTDSYIQSNLTQYLEGNGVIDDITVKNTLFPRLFNHAYPRADVENIYIYTLDGTVYDYSKRQSMDVRRNGGTEAWQEELDQASKDRFLLLPTMEHGSSGKQVISLVRNIHHIPLRNKIGAMKISINAEAMQSLLVLNSEEQLEEYLRVFILTDEKDVVYDNHHYLTGEKMDLDTSFLNGESPVGDIQWEGGNYLFSYEKSDYTNWNTLILISDEWIKTEQRRIQSFFILTGMLTITVIAVISYFLSHHITRPLEKMMKKMRRVERGELRERMNATGTMEIDVVSRVYNNMLDSINRLISEVYEAKLTEKNAKITALQSQINPHFLYNTLNIMKSISRVKGVEEVAEISESLADLFKYSMKHLKKPVSLREEMAHICNYMKIQNYRFGDRFTLQCDIPEELLTASIPKLTVQPLIENAVNHGLADRKRGGFIELSGRRDGDILTIIVKDNGKGIPPQALQQIQQRLSASNFIEKTQNESEGIGLVNIQQRIRLLYGETFGLTLESNCDSGTTVTLEWPFTEHSLWAEMEEK
ncbi:Sensor histidine kinase YesM [Evansella caseinilytica]|uniref:histidine kinase n=1 Tax=Evansella caseinilytica TaxID=1503961 RepID=A0A1H3IQZ9_9BACI|nr:sensor histidine kinase [Evansella caseinilytica]SDY30206.1 Sensor histidine kinase YesM [Evansella caseinilytica]